jgi:UDP-N-acetylmuramoyl-L-alanyl-D-glutamate--2,6-diaminopimelate ligase
MKLSELLTAVTVEAPVTTAAKSPNPEIRAIYYRSQAVTPGGLFVAIAGERVDGHAYIADAVARGAAAVVAERPAAVAVPVIIVADSRRALAALAARFHGCPAEKLVIVGITGTNGKTTTAYLIERILQQAGFSVGVIGTIEYRFGGQVRKAPVTTPESLDLQALLVEMVRAGVTHVVMEVSSHAIAMHRIVDCWLDVGVFTNLSQDHLDFHRDMQTYWEVKKTLFTRHLNTGPKRDRAVAVINSNDPRGAALLRELNGHGLSVGSAGTNRVHPRGVVHDPAGQHGELVTPEGTIRFASPLVGRHNLENILCAVGTAVALGIPLDRIRHGLEALDAVPGRLQPIPNPSGKFVFVDYAHTPGALENVLQCLQPLARGRIICVFGCGGDRDPGKRPQMGEIAARMSDLAIVTSDNPRTENPARIIDQVLAGVRRVAAHAYSPAELAGGFTRRGYAVEPDRRRAISLAVLTARPGDTILIAGKGHETYQLLGERSIDFDDCVEARRALENPTAGGGGTAAAAREDRK